MKIGNIVIDKDLKVSNKFNVVDSFDKIIEGKPTLIIGLNNVKKIETNLDYLDRKLSDDIYWTFSKSEKRYLFEEDLFLFINSTYKKIIDKIEYIFVDMFLYNNIKINEIFENLKKINYKISLKHKDMIYVYGDNKIFGFDLKQVKYMGVKIDRLMSKIISLSDVFLDDKDILIKYNNDLEMFDYQIKYIPLLYMMNLND